MWFDMVRKIVKTTCADPEAIRHLDENRDRITYTVDLIRKLGLTGKKICEIGAGGIGLGCAYEAKAEVVAFDCDEWFKPVCKEFSIPWRYIDLNQSRTLSDGPYDAILLCEVIEHLSRWPAEVLHDLGKSLVEGGLILVTTQNLSRLSNRLRMMVGKRIFANFVQEELVMGHLREYTPEELVFLFHRAGLRDVEWELFTFDTGKSRLQETAYKTLCHVFPRLSNFVFCWAYKKP